MPSSVDALAQELISKLPTGQLTLASLFPITFDLMKNAAAIETLSGSDKRALVIDCLELLAAKLPYPESVVVPLLIKTLAPLAIDKLVAAVRTAELDIAALLTRPKTVIVPLPQSLSRLGRKYHLRRQPADPRDHVYAPKLAATALPPKVDLSATSLPALEQGQLGSCSANSAAVILRYLLRKEKLGDWLPSRLYLYYNTRVKVEHTPASDDSGAVLRDVAKALALYHDCDETYWPYDTSKFSAAPSALAVVNANLHRAVGYHAVPQNLTAMKSCLAEGYPFQIGIQVYESFESDAVAKTGAVPVPDTASEQCLGGHALAVVGYDDAKQCFLVQNSWGAWGSEQKGLCLIPYAYILDPQIGSTDTWMYTLFK